MTGQQQTASQPDVGPGPAALRSRIPADRFDVLVDPLGWRCRACGAEVRAEPLADGATALARLSESAADHALFCGRCDD